MDVLRQLPFPHDLVSMKSGLEDRNNINNISINGRNAIASQ